MQENQGKDKIIADIQREIDGSKKNSVELLKKSELQYQRNKEQYEKDIKEKDQMIEMLQQQILLIQTTFDQKNQENEQHMKNLTDEIEHLNNYIKAHQSEMDNLKTSLQASEQDAQRVHELSEEISTLRLALEQKQLELQQWIDRSNQQKLKIEQLLQENEKMIDYEGKISLITTEFERMQYIIKQKNNELEDLRSKLNQQETKIIELQRYEGQNKQLHDKISLIVVECEKLQEVLGQRLDEIKNLKDQNQKYAI